jgi:hypothetical protein
LCRLRGCADLAYKPQVIREDEPEDVGTIQGPPEEPRLGPGHIRRQRRQRDVPSQSGFSLWTAAPRSPESANDAAARAAGLCRPHHPDSLTQQAIQPSGRYNHQVGTIGVVPTSAQRRSCRCCGYADVGLRSRARWGLPCVSGRHNPDVITVLTLGHCRGRAVWRGPHQQSSRRRSRAGTSCRRGHRCPQGLDRPSHPCHRSRRRPRAP